MPGVLFSCFKQRSQPRDSPSTLRCKALRKRLDSAKRVSPPTDLDSMTIEYLHIHQILPEALGDGMWKCCCGHENELAHWTGSHPFKHVTCYRCEHVLCQKCCTTEAFIPLDQVPQRLYQWKGAVNLAPFGQVCPDCGLTHRAKIPRTTKVYSQGPLDFDSIICACGRHSDSTWLRFHIGSIEAYRRNPHSAFAGVNIQRAERSVQQQLEGVDRDAWINTTELEDCPPPYCPPEYMEDEGMDYNQPDYGSKDALAAAASAVLTCDLKRRGAVRYPR